MEDDPSLVLQLLRAHITTAVYGGEVHYAESASGDVLGVAVWFGPGQMFLDSYVFITALPQVLSVKPCLPLERANAKLDGTNSWKS